MKRIYNAFLILFFFGMLSSSVQASCCNAGFSTPKIASSAKNWFRFIMHDSIAADIQSVHWSFGDGTYSTERTPYHAYYASGDYSVTLTVIKKQINGVKKSCTETHILPVTYACADFTYITSTLDVSFFQTHNVDSASAHISAKARNYTWVFGDGNVSNELNPTHTYAKAGTYNVCLYQNKANAPDAIGCSICHTVVVKDTTPVICRPEFSYSLTDTVVFLYSNSTIGNSYWWIEGDTNAHAWGNNAGFALSSQEPFTVCHRQYTDSIVGPGSAYCVECTTISHPVDTVPVICRSDFSYSLTDSVLYLHANSAIGDSYWWIHGDTAAHTWGNDAGFVISSQDSFTVCHRQYTDSIVGPHSAYCEECNTIRSVPPVDTIPTHCNSDFTYTLTGSTLALNAIESAPNSYWWYYADGVRSGQNYGGDTTLLVPSNGQLTVCHTQDNTSFLDTCIVCKVIRERHDTIPAVCYSNFDYTLNGSSVTAYVDSISYGRHIWTFANDAVVYDTLLARYTFTSPGTKRICQTTFREGSVDSCTTCKDIVIEAADISIHPNPAVHQITVKCKDGMIASIDIYDVNGMLVKTVSGLNVVKYDVNVSDLTSGIYYVSSVLTDGRVNKTKIIVQ